MLALCARFGLKCVVYMGAVDVARQAPNVFRMKMLGAEVIPVESGTRTLKDAMNEALRDWVTNVADTFYCIGTVAGLGVALDVPLICIARPPAVVSSKGGAGAEAKPTRCRSRSSLCCSVCNARAIDDS